MLSAGQGRFSGLSCYCFPPPFETVGSQNGGEAGSSGAGAVPEGAPGLHLLPVALRFRLFLHARQVQMAEAGFIHCPTENAPDVAQCFICFKELEGWEPEDDPMEEHRKHSPKCAFLALQKDIADLTVQEFIRLSKERKINLIKKQVNLKIIDIEKCAANVHNEISLLHL
ncbi:hypothetical protein JD844_011442 [Phrynosoma platyrhinos]|uniref:Baculoviral IAP repeat-containing protein 5 n=1 Tax=Phrynosoma platyrhinos TaxID=52577 RepID=A0ABQ7TJ71_PHRPL|nr:hypothetical protein JD844_011442 [Phrynosoma platyrhinos]